MWEKDGVDYRFVTLEKMQQLIADNLTVEHEIVYPADAASQ
ncbi:hypothetical protein KA478_04425 [Patescibacteria group bacterium]|nr:hypothetical protein [Patescibacteria group bacterium]